MAARLGFEPTGKPRKQRGKTATAHKNAYPKLKTLN